ncbi:hypothetical protein ACFYVL_42725 [Streptomyces sp. NPDC004111]|uniref:hypothetical protein n=1 Tax=Streptomyces sp. NPDC004111 TaxID=3364690 RepID=UPI0036A6A991
MRARGATVLTAAAAAFFFTAAPATAASAQGIEFERATSPTTSALGPFLCHSTAYAEGCFNSNGDWFSVKDKKKDGKSAVIKWVLRHLDGTEAGREGSFWMTEGAGYTRYKNKNFPERHSLDYEVCRGSTTTGSSTTTAAPSATRR